MKMLHEIQSRLVVILMLVIMFLAIRFFIVVDELTNKNHAADEGIVQHNGFHSWDEYENVKRLHRFHGTLYSVEEPDGRCTFERDGQKCLLWDNHERRK